MHILLIDDDTKILRVLSRYLAVTSDVTTALSAPTALKMVEDTKFDAIICDLQLPGKDGSWLLEQLDPWDAGHLIFITGEDCSRALDRPCLRKPFSRSELLAAVSQVVNH